jgi:hypothetical protein
MLVDAMNQGFCAGTGLSSHFFRLISKTKGSSGQYSSFSLKHQPVGRYNGLKSQVKSPKF